MRVQELFDLTGKVAIVTGGGHAASGGRSPSALAECGADIVVCARNAERCEAAAAELELLGVRALGLGCDVRDPASVEAVVRRTVETFGRVDILVNNAGTSWGAAPEDVPLAGWQKVIDVNLTGAFLFAQAVGRELIRQGDGGKIVNIASITAFQGAAARGVERDSLQHEQGRARRDDDRPRREVGAPRHLRQRDRARAGSPPSMSASTLERAGDDLVARIPLGRFGGPDDLKGAAAFLASPASDFVTGVTLPVDGGQLAG